MSIFCELSDLKILFFNVARMPEIIEMTVQVVDLYVHRTMKVSEVAHNAINVFIAFI